MFRFFKSAFWVLIFFTATLTHAQHNIELWWENQIKINVKTDGRWSFSNAISNRNFIAERISGNTTNDFKVSFIGLRHFTNYKFAKHLTASLGIRYRFLQVFNQAKSNEFRFTQQLTRSQKYGTTKLSHRFRLEQRIYSSKTTTRFRYRFSLKVPVCNVNKATSNFYFGANAELLYTISKRDFPFIDQRFTAKLSYSVFKNAALEVRLNYRFRNFLYADIEHQIFLLSVFAYTFK